MSPAVRRALPAFARPARPDDRWTGRSPDGERVVASRAVASLARAGGMLRLYLVVTRTDACVELPGAGGGCNPVDAFFASAPFEVVEDGRIVGAVVAPRVVRVDLETPSERVRVGPTGGQGVLTSCPEACAGDSLVGRDATGRTVFEVAL